MKINDIIIRHKSSELINSISDNMGIEIDNPDSEIIETNGNIIHLFKEFLLKITNKNNEESIAEFKLILQSEVLLNTNEQFSNKDYTQNIIPLLFIQINSMISEMNLPRLSFNSFANLIND